MSPAGTTRMVGPGLNVAELERSVAFYTEFLGLEEIARHELDDLTEAVLAYGSGGPWLMLVARPGQPGPVTVADWGRVAFSVKDVDRVARELKAAGHVASDPVEVELDGQTLVIVGASDPDGHSLELVEVRRRTPR